MDAHGYDNQVCRDYGSSWRIGRIRCHGNPLQTKALVYLVWQETILPISHDRSTSTTCSYAEFPDLHTPEVLGFSTSVPNVVDSVPSNTSYEDSIRRLCPITHAILNMRSSLPVSTSQSCTNESLYSSSERLRKDTTPDLQNLILCTTRVQHIEYLALTFSPAYAKSELCRPVIELKPSSADARNSQRVKRTQQLFVESAGDAIYVFLDLWEFGSKLVRTWATMHRVLSTSLVRDLVFILPPSPLSLLTTSHHFSLSHPIPASQHPTISIPNVSSLAQNLACLHPPKPAMLFS